jgi:hypothetical protein
MRIDFVLDGLERALTRATNIDGLTRRTGLRPCAKAVQLYGYFIVGITNCAFSRRDVGQREVTVFSRV